MDILKAEIARKRKQLEDAKVLAEGRKYFKRADLISKEEEEYLMKNAIQMAGESNGAKVDAKQVRKLTLANVYCSHQRSHLTSACTMNNNKHEFIYMDPLCYTL